MGGRRFSRDTNYTISKALSYILRHDISQEKNIIRCSDGFVRLDILAKILRNKGFTKDQILSFLKSQEAYRFELKPLDPDENDYIVRALYGHSISLPDSLGEPLNEDALTELRHYTRRNCLESIKKNGINRAKREYVHLIGKFSFPITSTKLNASKDVFVRIDVKRAIADGMKFYHAGGSVVLTKGFEGVVPPHYLMEHMELNEANI